MFGLGAPEQIRAGVLLVEDDLVVARMTEAHLVSVGIEAKLAQDLLEAREVLASWHPDVVLLDIEFPDGNGLTFCRELKEDPTTADIPVVMLTGLDDKMSVISAFRAGAVDYVRKPYIKEELLVRIATHSRTAGLLSELTATNQRLTRELKLAAKVQRSFLPDREARRGAFRTVVRFRPNSTLAGDMAGQCAVGEEQQAFFLLDVSGHGTGAALVAVAAVAQLTQLLAEGIFDPKKLEDELSNVLSIERTGLYGTLALVILDARSGDLRLYNYGHPPVLISADGRRPVHVLEASAPPLGMGYAGDVEEQRRRLAPGGRVLLYSDGLNEVTSPSFETVLAGMQGALSGEGDSLEVSADRLVTLCSAYRGEEHDDDATLLLVEYVGRPSESISAEATDALAKAHRHTFELPSALNQMAGFWACAEPLLIERGWGPPDGDALGNLRLGFTEAISNAILHAHDEDGRPLRIELLVADRAVELRVHDTGPGFAWPERRELPTTYAESGRGIFLIETLMDSARYVRRAGDNVLVLRKER
ncbi:MAG: hypothetical protein CSB49_06480 [Proteobacteria bacterium]|nr:MAG: hypothetical protein CSB49_06480 [Pseudomonadota bacterium]